VSWGRRVTPDPRILTIAAIRERLRLATLPELAEVLDGLETDLIGRRVIAAVHVSRARASLRQQMEDVRMSNARARA
jgi:lipopolysaccharide/colanic/teichoic acid biosynthesis glycosyltransferase